MKSEERGRPGSEAQLYFRHMQPLDQCLMAYRQNERWCYCPGLCYISNDFELCTYRAGISHILCEREIPCDTRQLDSRTRNMHCHGGRCAYVVFAWLFVSIRFTLPNHGIVANSYSVATRLHCRSPIEEPGCWELQTAGDLSILHVQGYERNDIGGISLAETLLANLLP